MQLKGTYIVEPTVSLPLESPYQRLSSPGEYDPNARAIVVRGLNPSYYLLFDRIDLIVSRYGSRLSHLAILAREAGVPIFVADHDFESIPPWGVLRVRGEHVEIVREDTSA